MPLWQEGTHIEALCIYVWKHNIVVANHMNHSQSCTYTVESPNNGHLGSYIGLCPLCGRSPLLGVSVNEESTV